MPAPDRDKLRAGLSGILSGGPEPIEEATPPPPKAKSAKAPPQKPEARDRKRGGGEEPSEEEGEHVRTTTGYVRADGDRVHRVSVMLTKGERRRLREMAEDAGLTVTDLVRQALGL